MLHEFGHFIDAMNRVNGKWYSESEEFRKIFQKYKKEHSNDYARTSSVEYFAESYEEYVLCPYRMKYNMPNTYRVMDRFMKEHGYR